MQYAVDLPVGDIYTLDVVYDKRFLSLVQTPALLQMFLELGTCFLLSDLKRDYEIRTLGLGYPVNTIAGFPQNRQKEEDSLSFNAISDPQ